MKKIVKTPSWESLTKRWITSYGFIDTLAEVSGKRIEFNDAEDDILYKTLNLHSRNFLKNLHW
jgi:hypothetical protein